MMLKTLHQSSKKSIYQSSIRIRARICSVSCVASTCVWRCKGVFILTVVTARLRRARLRLRRAAAQRAVHRRAAAPIKSDITQRHVTHRYCTACVAGRVTTT